MLVSVGIQNINMETSEISSSNRKKVAKLEAALQGKLITRFYWQFVQSLGRKTDADKRIQLYGKDPFK